MRNWGENCVSIGRNLLNLIRKQREKLGDLINKIAPKLDKEMERKTNYLFFYVFAL